MAFEIEDGVLKKYIPEVEKADVVVGENVTQIGSGAFAFSDIKSIILPKSLSYIDFQAFKNCKNLETVIIAEGIKSVHNFTFADCVNLKNIRLPETLEFIGKGMFFGCSSLESISLPSSITSIGDWSFKNCIALKEVVIPDNAKNIGKETFSGCSSLENVNLGKSINSIWYQAFKGCTTLTGVDINSQNERYKSIDGVIFNKQGTVLELAMPGISGHYTVPDGTEKINSCAFEGCRLLTGVSFPSSLTDIDFKAFYDCDGISEIIIPANVVQLGFDAFGKTIYYSLSEAVEPKLFKRITVDTEAGSISNGGNAFYLGNGTDPLVYPELPITFVADRDNKRRLGLGYCLNPEKYSGEYEKGYIKYVKSQKRYLLELANKLKLSGVAEFYNSLDTKVTKKKTTKKKVSIEKNKVQTAQTGEKPMTVAELKKEWTYGTMVWDKSYTGTESIKGIIIKKYKGTNPDVKVPAFIGKLPVYGIQYSAFSDNQIITSVIIPSSVFEIGDNAFSGCKNLKRVEILGDKIAIASHVFDGCVELSDLIIPVKNASFSIHPFQGCTKLADNNGFVILGPDDYRVLCDCMLPITKEELIVPNGVVRVDGYAFAKNFNPREYVAPNDKLRRVVLPNSIREIGNNAFADAVVLQQVVIPNGLESIGKMAFCSCEMLREIHIPASVTNIGNAILYDCNGITVYGATGSAIEDYAKKNNIAFAVEDKEETKNTESNILADFDIKEGVLNKYLGSNTDVKIPKGVTIIGNSAFNQNNNIKSVIIPEGVTEIQSSAFSDCCNLEKVILPDSLTSMSEYGAFIFCGNLKDINLPTGLTAIGDSTFAYCGFKDIVIPKSIINIGNGAFTSCKQLKKVICENGVKKIGNEAFYLCYNLEEVVIPNSVIKIGSKAFYGCGNLRRIDIPAHIENHSEFAVTPEDYYTEKALPALEYGGSSVPQWDLKALAYVQLYQVSKIHSDWDWAIDSAISFGKTKGIMGEICIVLTEVKSISDKAATNAINYTVKNVTKLAPQQIEKLYNIFKQKKRNKFADELNANKKVNNILIKLGVVDK